MIYDSPPISRTTSSPGVIEAPNSFIAKAVWHHKLLVAACAIACALLGTGIGYVRTPTYTAHTSLQVGEVNPNSPGFGSYTQSATALAAAFSRSIDGGPVLATIDRKLGIAPNAAASRLSTEPIPLSPLFLVIATGSSSSAATRLANVAGAAVVSYVTKSNSSDPQARALLSEYRSALLGVREAKARETALKGNSSTSSGKLLEAEAEKSAAKLKLEAIGRSYVQSVSSQAPRERLVSLLARAASASSDRSSKMEMLGLIGFLVGIVLGSAAAVVWERRWVGIEPDDRLFSSGG